MLNGFVHTKNQYPSVGRISSPLLFLFLNRLHAKSQKIKQKSPSWKKIRRSHQPPPPLLDSDLNTPARKRYAPSLLTFVDEHLTRRRCQSANLSGDLFVYSVIRYRRFVYVVPPFACSVTEGGDGGKEMSEIGVDCGFLAPWSCRSLWWGEAAERGCDVCICVCGKRRRGPTNVGISLDDGWLFDGPL